MWTREFLKNRAKAVLKVSYWKAFLISLIIAISGGGGNRSGDFNWNFNNHTSNNGFTPFTKATTDMFPFLLLFTFLIVFVIIIFALAFRIFLGYPLEVGARRFFVQSAQNNTDMNYLGYAFGNGRYFNIIKTMLWRGILPFFTSYYLSYLEL